MVMERAIVSEATKATAATDVVISYHYPVYVAVYALSRECHTCIASPMSFPRFFAPMFIPRPGQLLGIQSTRMVGIIVHSASNPTETIMYRNARANMFLKTGKRNRRLQFKRVLKGKGNIGGPLKLFRRDPPGQQTRLLLTVTNDGQPNYKGNSGIYRISFFSTRKRVLKRPGPLKCHWSSSSLLPSSTWLTLYPIQLDHLKGSASLCGLDRSNTLPPQLSSASTSQTHCFA